MAQATPPLHFLNVAIPNDFTMQRASWLYLLPNPQREEIDMKISWENKINLCVEFQRLCMLQLGE